MLVVDETRRTGGVSEGVIAALVDAGYRGRIAGWPARTASSRSARPPNVVLLDEPTIEKAAVDLVHAG